MTLERIESPYVADQRAAEQACAHLLHMVQLAGLTKMYDADISVSYVRTVLAATLTELGNHTHQPHQDIMHVGCGVAWELANVYRICSLMGVLFSRPQDLSGDCDCPRNHALDVATQMEFTPAAIHGDNLKAVRVYRAALPTVDTDDERVMEVGELLAILSFTLINDIAVQMAR